jgi:hypothetical protein
MAPSTESGLPFEGLICRPCEIFPVAGSASDDHHSLALSISGLLVTAAKGTGVPANVRFTPIADIGTQCRNVRFVPKAASCTAAIYAELTTNIAGFSPVVDVG